jgi:hypothetical protein
MIAELRRRVIAFRSSIIGMPRRLWLASFCGTTRDLESKTLAHHVTSSPMVA